MFCARFLNFKKISFADRKHFAPARWRLWSWINVSQPAGTAIIVPSISNRFHRPSRCSLQRWKEILFRHLFLHASEEYRGIRTHNRRIRLVSLSLFLFFCTVHITLPQSVSFSIIRQVIYFNLTPKTVNKKSFLSIRLRLSLYSLQ